MPLATYVYYGFEQPQHGGLEKRSAKFPSPRRISDVERWKKAAFKVLGLAEDISGTMELVSITPEKIIWMDADTINVVVVDRKVGIIG